MLTGQYRNGPGKRLFCGCVRGAGLLIHAFQNQQVAEIVAQVLSAGCTPGQFFECLPGFGKGSGCIVWLGRFPLHFGANGQGIGHEMPGAQMPRNSPEHDLACLEALVDKFLSQGIISDFGMGQCRLKLQFCLMHVILYVIRLQFRCQGKFCNGLPELLQSRLGFFRQHEALGELLSHVCQADAAKKGCGVHLQNDTVIGDCLLECSNGRVEMKLPVAQARDFRVRLGLALPGIIAAGREPYQGIAVFKSPGKYVFSSLELLLVGEKSSHANVHPGKMAVRGQMVGIAFQNFIVISDGALERCLHLLQMAMRRA